MFTNVFHLGRRIQVQARVGKVKWPPRVRWTLAETEQQPSKEEKQKGKQIFFLFSLKLFKKFACFKHITHNITYDINNSCF
jgi:hypothetical protein